ncbi:MAG: hypothetical protein P4N41_17260 [Negativicutes bacterium]|nr:hypothetical protein [Negativicutes bacterium]
MEYIIITLLAISATTFIIYMLANKVFGVLLRLKSLVLCAVCALVISVILPRIVVSFAGLAGTVGFLAVFAVIFAYLVAYYDDPGDLQATPGATTSGAAALPQTDSPVPVIADTVLKLPPSLELPVYPAQPMLAETVPPDLGSLPAAAAESAAEPTEILPVPPEPLLATALENTDLQSLPEPGAELAVDFAGLVLAAASAQDQSHELEPDQPDREEEEQEQLVSPPPDDDTEPEPSFDPSEEETFDQVPLGDTPLEIDQLAPLEDFLPDPDPDPEPEPLTQAAAETGPPSQPEAAAETEPEVQPPDTLTLLSPPDFQPESATEPEPEPPTETTVSAAEPSAAPESFLPALPTPEDEQAILPAAEDPSEIPEVTAITAPSDLNPVSDSLDDLLDFAFSQKEGRNHPLALDTFRQALKLYQDSDAAPYIAIEIVTLLKDKGAYDEAIMLLTQCRGLPGLQHNDPLSQEFVTTIAYLRIVKNILLESRMGYLPFNSIPTEVSQEIDAEFREWRNLA